MGRQLSMTTRKELIEGIGKRYRASNRKEKQQILENSRVFTTESTPFARSIPWPCRKVIEGVKF